MSKMRKDFLSVGIWIRHKKCCSSVDRPKQEKLFYKITKKRDFPGQNGMYNHPINKRRITSW